MDKIRNMLTMDNSDDYELENPREIADFSNFGKSNYLEERDLPPIKVYIYGNYPHFEKSTIYFMFRKHLVDFRGKMTSKFDMGFFWDARMQLNRKSEKLQEAIKKRKIRLINFFLIDTSKEFVGKTVQDYFGYTFTVDPNTYDGYCIAKHNGNGTKSCFFLKCPINADEIFHDHSYQKIINYSDKKNKNILYELRLPIFGNIIPFAFFKTRNRGLRFTSKNKLMEIVPADKHLSPDELNQILGYCQKVGFECGEIDVLRHDEDGKIYIIDINNTSWWPPNKLFEVKRNIALNMMWNAWLEYFLPDKFNDYHIPDDRIDDYISSTDEKVNNRKKMDISYNGFKFVGNKKQNIDFLKMALKLL